MFKLDVKDRKLIACLEDDSRATLSNLAKKINLSREAVNYRIGRLLKNNVIKSFITVVDITKLGYTSFALYFKLQNITEEKEKEMVEYFVSNKNVAWVASIGGSYDLVVELSAESIPQFNTEYSSILSKYSHYITQSEVIIRMKQLQLPRTYIHGIRKNKLNLIKNTNKQKANKQNEEKAKIDEIDKKMLFLITENSRLLNIEMSKRLGVSQTTISCKLKRLEKSGVIRKYSIFFNPESIGYQSFKVLISLRELSEDSFNKFLNYAKEKHNIYYFVRCIGQWNIEIESDSKNIQEFQEILRDIKNHFSDIINRIDFVVIFKEHKYVYFNEKML